MPDLIRINQYRTLATYVELLDGGGVEDTRLEAKDTKKI